MCTAIKNGLLMSQPTPNEASNFSPHFTPPVDAEDGLSAESQLRLEEQARNGKLSSVDMTMITRQRVRYPVGYGELRHYIKNRVFLNMTLAGRGVILVDSLEEVNNHVIKFEIE